MTTLVAGCAALYDLLGSIDTSATADGRIGVLTAGPALDGTWLPGGSAPTVALAMAERGVHVALWHPLRRPEDDPTRARLAAAGVDVSPSPAVDGAAHCIVLRGDGGTALAWSGVAPLWDEPAPSIGLDGCDHLVLCPRLGPWSASLVERARGRGIPCSIVGEAPPAGHWRVVVASTGQIDATAQGEVDAELLVVTRGAAGARIRAGAEWLEIEPSRAQVVDPTGAGDVFAGVLLGELERGTPVREAARQATDAAAAACERWGAQSSLTLAPRSGDPDRSHRARGALWGLACGDAFGMPASFVARSVMDRLWPSGITEMIAAPDISPYHVGYPEGRVTDDTEQALALTRAAVASGGLLDPQAVARELDAWYEAVGGNDSLAVGPSTRRGLMAWRAGTRIEESGRLGTSNGAAMRITPIGVLHGLLGSPLDSLLADVAAACLVTHNSGVAMSGAAAVAGAVAAGVRGEGWDAVLAQGVAAARAGRLQGHWVYAPDVALRIERAIQIAMGASNDREASELLAQLVGTGEPTAESVPAAFGIAARAAGDPQYALRLAANTEGDADTIGAMAGAICGAWAGEGAIPAAWRERVAATSRIDAAAWLRDLESVAARRAGLLEPTAP